jgi:hypothetical protein
MSSLLDYVGKKPDLRFNLPGMSSEIRVQATESPDQDHNDGE